MPVNERSVQLSLKLSNLLFQEYIVTIETLYFLLEGKVVSSQLIIISLEPIMRLVEPIMRLVELVNFNLQVFALGLDL